MKLTLFFCFKTNLCLFMNQISCQRRHFSCDDCQKEQFTTLFVDNYKNITVTTNSWNFDNKVFSQHCFVVKSANFLLIFFVVHFVFLSTIPFFEHIPIFSQTPFSHPTILVNFSFFTRSSLLFILLTTKLTSKMQSKHKHQNNSNSLLTKCAVPDLSNNINFHWYTHGKSMNSNCTSRLPIPFSKHKIHVFLVLQKRIQTDQKLHSAHMECFQTTTHSSHTLWPIQINSIQQFSNTRINRIILSKESTWSKGIQQEYRSIRFIKARAVMAACLAALYPCFSSISNPIYISSKSHRLILSPS